jgi:hypothetical protein
MKVLVDGTHVEADRGPAVLRPGGEPLDQLQLGGPDVRVAPRVRADLNQGIGFLGTGRDDAPGPVVLETAADQVHAVGQQGRGQGVACVAVVAPVVEVERPGLGAVDTSAGRQAAALRHAGGPL